MEFKEIEKGVIDNSKKYREKYKTDHNDESIVIRMWSEFAWF